jgi:hypothetical protein
MKYSRPVPEENSKSFLNPGGDADGSDSTVPIQPLHGDPGKPGRPDEWLAPPLETSLVKRDSDESQMEVSHVARTKPAILLVSLLIIGIVGAGIISTAVSHKSMSVPTVAPTLNINSTGALNGLIYTNAGWQMKATLPSGGIYTTLNMMPAPNGSIGEGVTGTIPESQGGNSFDAPFTFAAVLVPGLTAELFESNFMPSGEGITWGPMIRTKVSGKAALRADADTSDGRYHLVVIGVEDSGQVFSITTDNYSVINAVVSSLQVG